MKRILLLLVWITCSPLFAAQAYARPLWSFSPLTATSFQLPTNQVATVQYLVTNNSSKPHTLVLSPLSGIVQTSLPGGCLSPFVLTQGQSCVLTLIINGNQLLSSIIGGPKVCQQGPNGMPNPLQCYQPNAQDSLNITLSPASTSLFAGAQNGNVYYSANNALSWTASTPAGDSAINALFTNGATIYAGSANGLVYWSSNNGNSWSLIANPAPGFSVNGLYVSAALNLYIASASNRVYICALNGSHCAATTSPSDFAINSVLATPTGLYAGSDDGNVYYSINNGLSWSIINGQPDGSAIQNLAIIGSSLYVNTTNEYLYTTNALSGGGIWSIYAQSVYRFATNAAGTEILAGNQAGYLFLLTSGTQLGFIANTAIKSISSS